MIKLLYPIGITLITVLSGLWLGEHQGGPVPVRDLLALLAVAIASLWPLWRVRRTAALLTALGIAVVFIVPWFVGAHESQYAFNDCVQNGEQVREALLNFRSEHGFFPDTLADLNVHLPGQLLFPPHTLNYMRTSTGFDLYFSDWLVSHEATESYGFRAHK
ncbi:MAG: hypothetical protein L6428_12505 [Candidatus Aminicenantes bacterium]|nr:hypothetical protein [Acidobacteriota bacterium]MCG2812254.1 hypothetical protein [Candidatus Aminicenantes bacterium]